MVITAVDDRYPTWKVELVGRIKILKNAAEAGEITVRRP